MNYRYSLLPVTFSQLVFVFNYLSISYILYATFALTELLFTLSNFYVYQKTLNIPLILYGYNFWYLIDESFISGSIASSTSRSTLLLAEAIKFGDVDVIKCLINKGALFKECIVYAGQFERYYLEKSLCQLLLESGADVNA